MAEKYIPTEWRDHIIDIESNDVIQEGTRFTASRANNIEDGILGAYKGIDRNKDDLTRLRVQVEMIGRAPINSGTFFDTIEGEGGRKSLVVMTESAIVQEAVSSGATTIKLGEIPFKTGEYVTIYDDEMSETVKVVSAAIKNMTVEALTNAYKKGARVVRTNSVPGDVRNTIGYGSWGNYSIDIREVI